MKNRKAHATTSTLAHVILFINTSKEYGIAFYNSTYWSHGEVV